MEGQSMKGQFKVVKVIILITDFLCYGPLANIQRQFDKPLGFLVKQHWSRTPLLEFMMNICFYILPYDNE